MAGAGLGRYTDRTWSPRTKSRQTSCLGIYVEEWIDRRFTDPGLSLADAAQRFGVNERTIRRALDARDTRCDEPTVDIGLPLSGALYASV